MDAFEVHINVNLGLQELNSNSNRDILPEEIDIAVNICMNRFISEHIKPNNFNPKGFSGTEKDLDDIATLLESKMLTPISITDFQLPADYLHRISGRASVFETCDTTLNKSTTTKTEALSFLPFNLSSNLNGPYYEVVSLLRGGIPIFTKSLDAPNSSSIKSKEERYLLVDVMLNILRDKGYKVYWESYGNVRRSGNFIFVDSTTIPYQLTVDGSNYVSEPAGTASYTVYQNSEINLRPSSKLRDDQTDNFPSAFLKSDYNGVLYTMEKDRIKVFPDKSIIVNGFWLNYIRKPKRFSVILNQGLDLPESVHQDVVDLTIEYLSGTISKQNLEWKVQDNQLNIKQF